MAASREELMKHFKLFEVKDMVGFVEKKELKFILTNFGVNEEDKLTDE